MTASLRQKTVTALIWSAFQSWGVKLLSLAVFFVLARYLRPDEIGLAQTVILILAFIAILSEQGFQDAIVQRKSLVSADLNLPFAISILTAVVASAMLLLFAVDMAVALKVPAAAPLISASAIVPPIAAASVFEAAMRRRNLDFKTLAKATLIAGLLSSTVALVMAVSGFGAASLVVQAIITAVVTFFILWRRALWKPGREFVSSSFKELLGYSTSAFGSRLLDFFSGKIIDLIILNRFGVAALGLYTVGSKLYLTLLQLLASTLIDVALSAMSRISGDMPRLRSAYLRFLYLASCTTLPLFVGVAVLSSEVCHLLFGSQWSGAAGVARWLFLLGAVQVVQFFNSSVLGATGQARQILALNLLKLTSGFAVLVFVDAESIELVTVYFVASQLVISPVSFYLGIRAANSSALEVLRQLVPGFVAAAVAGIVTEVVRNSGLCDGFGLIARTAVLATVYVLTVAVGIWISGAKKIALELSYLATTFNQQRRNESGSV